MTTWVSAVDGSGVDSVIKNDYPASPGGSQTYAIVGHYAYGDPGYGRMLIKFPVDDIANIPAAATITNAVLTLPVALVLDNAGDTGNHSFNVYRLKRAWTEGSATWNMFDSVSSWTTPGAGDTTNDRDAATIGTVTVAYDLATSAAITLDTTLLQQMLSGGSFANNGFIIQSTAEGSTRASAFGMANHGTQADRPYLTVDYFIGATSQTAVPASDTSNAGSWTQDDGATQTALYSRISELPYSDADFIQSIPQPVNSLCSVHLGTLLAPVAGTRTLHLRARKDVSGGIVDLVVNLKSGGVLVQSFSGGALSNLSTTWTAIDLVVSNAVGNYGNLDVELQANQSG